MQTWRNTYTDIVLYLKCPQPDKKINYFQLIFHDPQIEIAFSNTHKYSFSLFPRN